MTYLRAAALILGGAIGILIALTGKTTLWSVGIIPIMLALLPYGDPKPKPWKIGSLCSVLFLLAGFVFASWKADGDVFLWIGLPMVVLNIVAIIIAARSADPAPPTSATSSEC